MTGKKVRTAAAVAALGAMTAIGSPAGFALAQPVISVPCSAAALATAFTTISGNDNATTLSLSPHCLYVLTKQMATIPVPNQGAYIILGHDATLVRSYDPGIPKFALIQSFGALTVDDLNFRNGVPAINFIGLPVLTVNGSTFTDNHGAIYTADTGQGPVIDDTVFTGNTSTGYGAAIWDFSIAEGAVITDSRFYDNHADGGGGAVEAVAGGGGVISHDVFEGNSTGGDGGAIADGEGMSISDSQISDNRAGGTGGGIDFDGPGAPFDEHVSGDQIEGNTASVGGGLANETGSMIVTDTDIIGNHASSNGGGYIGESESLYSGEGGATTAMTGTTISGNSAGSLGGGIYNETGDNQVNAALSLSSGQVIGNGAGTDGGGIYGAGVTLTRTPVLFNRPDNCAPPAAVPGCTG